MPSSAGECQRNGGGVPHLAHQDNIGVLAARHLECVRKAQGMGPDFTLRKEAFFIRVNKLQRSSIVMMWASRISLI